mgnify:FL=1
MTVRSRKKTSGNAYWLGLGLLWTSLVQAQSIPDTLDWRRYFPLQIGNEWHYVYIWTNTLMMRTQWYIIGDTLLDNEHYFVFRVRRKGVECCFDQVNDTLFWYIRYDTVNACVYRKGDGCYWPGGSCRLDAPFYSQCGDGWNVDVHGGYNMLVKIDKDTIRTAKKSFSTWDGSSVSFLADIGLYETLIGESPGDNLETLVYARIGTKSYGTPTSLAVETKGMSGRAGIVDVWPHPVRSGVRVSYVVERAGAVALLLYDVLGRQVWQVEEGVQGPGRHQVQLWVADLPAGVYLLRLIVGGQVLDDRPLVVLR